MRAATPAADPAAASKRRTVYQNGKNCIHEKRQKNRKKARNALESMENNGIFTNSAKPKTTWSEKMTEKPKQTCKQEWTQIAKPKKGSTRSRRIALMFSPELADRLVLMARMNGVSVNNEVETLVEREYTRLRTDPKTKALIKALAKQSEANQ